MNLIRKVLFLNKSKIFKISPIKNVELVTEKVLTQVEASNTSDIKLLKEALLFSKETFFSSIFFDREKEKLYKLIESSEEI